MKLELSEAIGVLSALMEDKKLVAFIGSGISLDSGLPNWEGLILEFIDLIQSLKLNNKKDAEDLKQITTDALNRKGTSRFDPISIATVLKNRLKKCDELYDKNSMAYGDYNSWVAKMFNDRIPNSKHSIIVKTNYPILLTSNYDNLLQKAAFDAGYTDIASNVYTYKQQIPIMSAIHNSKPCIIHVHGIANSLDIDELIFAKEDYNKIVLKHYEGFSFALRMLFTRYSTLFLGYGASDPHLEEVLEELSTYFPIEEGKGFTMPESYLVTLRSKADSILEAYKGRVRTNLILIDDFSQYNELLLHLQSKYPRI